MGFCLGRTKQTEKFGVCRGFVYPPDTQVEIIGYSNGIPICKFPHGEVRKLISVEEAR